ncbi:hypothetical protein [Conexibacter sp. SYSU D00693]|uniref:hypothetical protein n=1 Tax=Conexibacter sp. SYSU D00693 TaxID=2812560 RepID=UPI00196B57DD|nr:hypothetical protein [Conexibacter sp. SYSU D00693]
MAAVVHIPWYATVFRGDKLEAALEDIAKVSVRYGAKSFAVYRYNDDRYKFLQVAEFEDKTDWERYWDSPEFTDWRIANQSYFQVPVVYGMTDLVVAGTVNPELLRSAAVPAGETEGDLAG